MNKEELIFQTDDVALADGIIKKLKAWEVPVSARVFKKGKQYLYSILSSMPTSAKVAMREYVTGSNNPIGRIRMQVHPEALESLNRYKDDLKAGHAAAAEYWRGQASAYFTANPLRERTVIYDNGGKTKDRYTLVLPNGDAWGFDENPYYPTGFGQYAGNLSHLDEYSHIGKRIGRKRLPLKAQRFVGEIMKEYHASYEEDEDE